MTTLACRYLAIDCLDTLSAADSKEIQKVFLDHVHAKHPNRWRQFSKQFKVVTVVTIRNHFLMQAAKDLKDRLRTPGTPSIDPAAGGSSSRS